MFVNRQHAGRLLAGRLKEYLSARGRFCPGDTVIVGLPRGGVPVAAEVAGQLRCPIDILVAKKIRAPDNPEVAIGAVSSTGVVVLDEGHKRFWTDPQAYERAQRAQKDELIGKTRQQETAWLEAAGMTARPEWRGRRIVLCDDGVATGMTTMAAIGSARQKGASEIIVATPVTPYDTYLILKEQCDHVLSLAVPHDFSAVGCYYDDVHQLADDEVVNALRLALALQV